MRIAIITAAPNSYSVKSLLRAIRERDHLPEIIDPEDLYIYISDKKQGFDRIYQKELKIQKNEINAIIPRIGSNLEFGAVTVEHFNKNLGIFSTASASGLLCAQNKMKNQMRLSQAKIRVPKMAFANRPQDFKFLVDLVGGIPCVAKLQTGSQGAGVFLIESELAASATLTAFSKIGVNLILQELIETEKPKYDIRAYVVGDEIAAQYKRFALDKDFRSNYSLSHQGEITGLSTEEKEMIISAARATGLAVCGVDLIRKNDEAKTPYILEVNGNASLKGIETVTKIDVAGKIIEYVERNYKKKSPEGIPGAKSSVTGQEKANSVQNSITDTYSYNIIAAHTMPILCIW